MSYNFEAIIKKISDKDATFIEIPFDVEKEFGARRVKVKTKFDGIDYRGSILNMGQDCFIIGITKAVRKQIGKDVGDTVFIEVEKDEEIREVEIPEDFKSELDKNKEALNFYNSLSYSAKRKYYQWITGAKQETTRQKRITESVSKLESKIKL
ncbi:hypothetical protein UT300012_00580 [Paraclostridium bifermentans]|jgi:hypothetical protein|uniref:YdeI/OmpD-associated family protein n=1 Tax=Paraclostridium bifermentans TaxID=1490 RepID=UPI001C10AB06|nr:YdeI/OmpD-associated family protein [Paraclostridium bifermentans]MBU5286989.1 YdeI/OmpD-associated family protein [Paraclostridium bifermentans]